MKQRATEEVLSNTSEDSEIHPEELDKDNDGSSKDPRNTNQERIQGAEKKIDEEFGAIFRFLWAIVQEPQLVNKIATKTCTKPSTEI